MTAKNLTRRVSSIVALALTVSACGESPRISIGQSVQTHVGRLGDLKISVTEKAEIQAARQVTVSSKLEGRATLIYLAPEGSMVDSGDRLAQLDVSALEEKRSRQAIAVAKAEAALSRAQKSLEIMDKDLEASANSASSKLTIARLELQKFLGRLQAPASVTPSTEGTNLVMLDRLHVLLENDPKARDHAGLEERMCELLGPEENHHRKMGKMANDVLQKIDEIRLARAKLELDLDTYNHSKRLAAREFITRNELQRDKLSYESQASKVDLAWNALDLLINYSLQQTQIRLKQDVEKAELDLLSTIGNNESRRVKEAVELKSKQAELSLALESLENWNRQIDNGTIYAPNPGLVVYAKQSRRWNSQAVEEGMEVRKGQPLINLPDLEYMIAKLKVQESDIDNVKVDHRATVRADAFPNRLLEATVSKVAPLPDSANRWRTDLRVYETTIALEGRNIEQALRPGMSATVEILVEFLRDVVSVPLQAVQREGDVHYVWQVTDLGTVATRVEVGRNSLTNVEIREGLHEGDVVYLVVPPGASVPEFADDSVPVQLHATPRN